MKGPIKVYYDFVYPEKEGLREPGLYRTYFKYARTELLKQIKPIFDDNKEGIITKIASRGTRRILNRVRRLPLAFCSNARDADLLHLFIKIPAFFNMPWISECECIDQYAVLYGHDASCLDFRNSFIRILEHKNFKKILIPCQASANAFRALQIPADKVVVSYLAGPALCPKTHTEKGGVHLLFNFGSNPLFFSKGGRELLDSFKVLKAKYPGLQLTIVGNDSPEKIKITDGTSFKGFVPYAQYINQILPSADILVHPTHMDSFGYVILEAMAAGLPIVATKHYAIPEIIIHDINGYLVDDYKNVWYESDYVPKPNYRSDYHSQDRTFGTPAESRLLTEQLIHYLDTLIQYPDIRQRMGDANHEQITQGKFSPARKIQQLLSIYRESLES